MIGSTSVLRTAFCAITLLVPVTAMAQQGPPPAGSCLISEAGADKGKWCWPAVPARFGQPCTCETADGPKGGTGQ